MSPMSPIPPNSPAQPALPLQTRLAAIGSNGIDLPDGLVFWGYTSLPLSGFLQVFDSRLVP